METVKLKNGAEEAKPLVTTVMMSLNRLIEEGKFIVVYELAMKCRDRNHQLFGQSGKDLKALRLINDDESIHDSIRNIVLSAVNGDGLDMEFGSPIAP